MTEIPSPTVLTYNRTTRRLANRYGYLALAVAPSFRRWINLIVRYHIPLYHYFNGNKMELTPSKFVTIEGTFVSVNATGVTEAKLALKELKLKKKEYGLQKKMITSQQKELRVAYSDEVRYQGPLVRGDNVVGDLIRAAQTFSRDSKRLGLDAQLAALEKVKLDIESMIHTIDKVIIQVEAQLLKHGA